MFYRDGKSIKTLSFGVNVLTEVNSEIGITSTTCQARQKRCVAIVCHSVALKPNDSHRESEDTVQGHLLILPH